ncbi:MAG: VanZ family protein [Marinifilaceae bacterium]|nr:VanZ family protein [Marinifilaceae bacterium]
MKKHLLRNILWCIVIFILCTMPVNDVVKTEVTIPFFDKIVHFIMFFIMGIFICSELIFQTKYSYKTISWITILLVGLYGGIIELIQNYIFTYRSGDYYDLLADVLGGIFGVLMYPLLKKYKEYLLSSTKLGKIKILHKIL